MAAATTSHPDWLRFLSAERREQLGLLRACGAVAAAKTALLVLPVERAAARFGLALCRGESSRSVCESAEVTTAARHVRAVLRRWPSRQPCLVGALATGALLRHLRPTVFIGVKRRGATIAAHAWLDVPAGRVAIAVPDDYQDFVPLRRSPPT